MFSLCIIQPYPAASDVELMSKDEAAYTAAHEAVDRLKVEQAQPDRQDQRRDHHHRGPRPVSVVRAHRGTEFLV